MGAYLKIADCREQRPGYMPEGCSMVQDEERDALKGREARMHVPLTTAAPGYRPQNCC